MYYGSILLDGDLEMDSLLNFLLCERKWIKSIIGKPIFKVMNAIFFTYLNTNQVCQKNPVNTFYEEFYSM